MNINNTENKKKILLSGKKLTLEDFVSKGRTGSIRFTLANFISYCPPLVSCSRSDHCAVKLVGRS